MTKFFPELSLVIPYYYDAGCPIPFVTSLEKELKKYNIDYELILVDDCSGDSTPQELSQLKSERVKVILNKKNQHFGGAIQTGFEQATGKIFGFSCGDGDVSPENVVKVYNNVNGMDVVKARRLNRNDGIIRKIITNMFLLLTRIKFGLKLKDINGFPVFLKREIYLDVRKRWKLKNDFNFNIDLYNKLNKLGYKKIEEITIMHNKRISGESKLTPKRLISTIWEFLKL